jgi:hypothetical protein
MMNRQLLLVVAVWAAAALTAPAQFAPLHYSAPNAIVDEFGQMLQGTDSAASQFGHPVVTGDLVQILRADTGVYAPTTNGSPHASNAVLMVSRIGAGVDPGLGTSGKFGGAITIPERYSSTNVKVIARVFNAPTLEQASFYGDSQVYPVPGYGEKYGVFFATITATTQALDTTDWDGDGLVRSWEISYDTDPDDADSDDDGSGDSHEVRAGTDPNSGASLLIMVQLVPAPPDDLNLLWDSVAGKTYQVEYTTGSYTNEATFLPLNGPVTATGALSQTVHTNGLSVEQAHYRVRLVE